MTAVGYGHYAFLHARLGAFKGELLTRRDWEQLVDAGDFSAQRHVLENTGYASFVGPTIGTTVGGCYQRYHQMVRKIEKSVPASAARFIRFWALRDLLRNVKTILKGKSLQRPEAAIAADLVNLGPQPGLPTELLLGSSGVEEALDLLETTELRPWIRETHRIYQRDRTMFGLDAALDRLYYRDLWRQLTELAPADRVPVEQQVVDEIDQVNLLWLMRYRLNYGLSPAETYYLLIPVTGRIDSERLKTLVRQDSLAAMIGQLAIEPLHRLLAPCQSLSRVEVVLWRYRARRARRLLRQAVFSLGEAVAFLQLLEMEVRDLVAVLHSTLVAADRRTVRQQLTFEGE
jgi:V/A-type H+-transporting ATPase subunit C